MQSLILSVKWDTNGGNERFRLAAGRNEERMRALIAHSGQDYGGQGARWALASGTEMHALHLAAGQETAGIGSRYAAASRPVEGLVIRAAHRTQTYLDYPYDILWDRTTDALVRRLADEADVIHLNDRTFAYAELALDRRRKPALLHHHGMAYRTGYAHLNAEARRYRMVQAVSTIDLLRNAGEGVTWLPAPYNLDEMAAIRRANRRRRDGRVLVAQTPTNRAIKSTAKLEAAVARLRDEGLPVDLVIGEQMPWREALPLKASADIFFDQVQLGYGCSAIEAWGMGLPVIAGGDQWTEDRMRREFGADDLPFLKAEDTEESIYAAVRALALSKDMRAEYGARGRAHARRFHDELPALERLVDLYQRAIRAQRAPARPAPSTEDVAAGAGSFRSTKYPALAFYSGEEKFKFSGGRLAADPDRAPLVRLFMARPSSAMYGITEDTPPPPAAQDAPGGATMAPAAGKRPRSARKARAAT